MNLVFTLTAGRTGTAFLATLLAQNLRDAEVHHERTGYDSFGVDSPDLSDLVLYNTRGNILKVQRFWERKFSRILRAAAGTYVETSHVLMKAGLVENAVRLCAGHTLHFIRLNRALIPTLLSYASRGDFLNKSSQWLWYLDDDYSRTFLRPDRFRGFGLPGLRLWYLMEIEFRATYFKMCYENRPGIHFHAVDIENLNDPEKAREIISKVSPEALSGSVTIPEKVNVSPETGPPDRDVLHQLEALVAGTEALDPVATAREYIREGIDPFAPEEPAEDLWKGWG